MSADKALKALTLVLGGARSGKSAFAERLASEGGRVLFAATAEAGDVEMAERIARHRARRPSAWGTLEAPLRLAAQLRSGVGGYDTVLLDSLTLWVSNLLLRSEAAGGAASDVHSEASDLLEAYREGPAAWIVVSDEVGSGIVPPMPLGRAFRDALGGVNQLFAAQADRVFLTVAGLPLTLKPGAATTAPPREQAP